MSDIINDVAIGVNLIQGFISMIQKATHPFINHESVSQFVSQAHTYCEDMQTRHIVPAQVKNRVSETVND